MIGEKQRKRNGRIALEIYRKNYRNKHFFSITHIFSITFISVLSNSQASLKTNGKQMIGYTLEIYKTNYRNKHFLSIINIFGTIFTSGLIVSQGSVKNNGK